jgi:hypothetical protein
MTEQTKSGEFLPDSEVLASVISLFERVSPDSRERLLQTLATYLGIAEARKNNGGSIGTSHVSASGSLPKFTEDRSLTAKEFILQKEPHTDVERVACLAYYLTHYNSQPHFKTVDVSRLNTEAAQIKFSNPAFAVVNATNLGYLTQAGKGYKQLSAMGERFVAALPDRDAAKAVMSGVKRRRAAKKMNVG